MSGVFFGLHVERFEARGGGAGLFIFDNSCCIERRSFNIFNSVLVSRVVARHLFTGGEERQDGAGSGRWDGVRGVGTYLESVFNVAIKFASLVWVIVNSSQISFTSMLI